MKLAFPILLQYITANVTYLVSVHRIDVALCSGTILSCLALVNLLAVRPAR